MSHDPFFEAVRRGQATVVAELLERDPRLVAERSDGGTALHFAAWEGHLSVVDVLLGAGAELNARDDRHGMLPIAWANEHGHVDMVRALHARGADVPFQLAAAFGLLEALRDSLSADPELLDQVRGYGTALHFAALWGQVEVVKFLIEAGADLHARNENGELALGIARRQTRPEARDTMLVVPRRKREIQEGCLRIVELLEARGAPE